jgi:V/A-type H+-transporting ATPase subunit I
MAFLRPLKMVKVGLIGLKDDREVLLSVVHDLGVTQVETISRATLEHVEPEKASDLQRTVGDQLIRVRGLRAALPASVDHSRRSFPTLDDLLAQAHGLPIDEEVGTLKREEDRLLTERKGLTDEIDLLHQHPYYTDRLEYLSGSQIVAFFGEAAHEGFEEWRADLPRDAHLVIGSVGETIAFLVAVPTAEADAVGRAAQQRQIPLTVAPRREGTSSEVTAELTEQRARIDTRLTEIRARLTQLSVEWYPTIIALEEALTIESRKLEVFTKLGATERTFALEGWVAVRDRAQLESAVHRAVHDRVTFYEVPTTEEPPTYMLNPPGVRWYEFFIRFYSLPMATEWDPTWIFAIVFPIFFGLMLGDWGYGVVILSICLWMIAGFPGRTKLPNGIKNIPKMIMGPNAMRSLAYALVPGCLVAIGAGIYFNEFFGAHVLPISAIEPISKEGTTALLLLAGYIGLAMVTFGFVLGALKEYFHHHLRGAIGKVGGIGFAWGIALVGLRLIRHQLSAPSLASPVDLGAWSLLAGGFLAMLIGEGGMALLGLIEVVSHILSYTRIAGILLASVVLTLVGFDVANGLHTAYGIGGLIVGAIIVFVIQVFNIILGVFEPGIQGARLIFVENFSKYFSGNGKAFRPLGSRRVHTEPSAMPVAPP